MSAVPRLRYSAHWSDLGDADRAALVNRSVTVDAGVRETTARIVADVRARGDVALREMALRYDGVSLERLEVAPAVIQRALATLDPALRTVLERAATNIAIVHSAFRPVSARATPEAGITITRRPDPLARVGIYAPGGRASYPSSVLMAAVPAKVAGVGEIVLASPAGAAGAPAKAVLAAAAIAGVDRVFAIGGAGAIAALAYGTATVPRVERIVGPGNAYVAMAKLMVLDQVAIDCPAGPSELVVIADDTSDARVVAKEMVAQAEHDPEAVVVALTIGAKAREAVLRELALAMDLAARRDIVAAALGKLGGVIEVPSSADAVRVANAIAPEHLLLAIDDARTLMAGVRNAGTVFVGSSASVAYGDYMTGANHVLPTGGAARAWSGLSPLDFVRWTTIQTVNRDAAARLAADVATFATAEGLPGHAAAALQWSAP